MMRGDRFLMDDGAKPAPARLNVDVSLIYGLRCAALRLDDVKNSDTLLQFNAQIWAGLLRCR